MALCGERQQTLLTMPAVQRISVLLGLETMTPSLLGMSLREHHWRPLAFVRLSKIGLRWVDGEASSGPRTSGSYDEEGMEHNMLSWEGGDWVYMVETVVSGKEHMTLTLQKRKKKKMREALYLCSPSLWSRTDQTRPFLMEDYRLWYFYKEQGKDKIVWNTEKRLLYQKRLNYFNGIIKLLDLKVYHVRLAFIFSSINR